MANKKSIFSGVVHVECGDKAVAMMIRGTTDSKFVLVRGIPGTTESRLDDYLWADVMQDGKSVELTASQNPVVIDIPGTYRFRNEGLDDEQALVDITVYARKTEVRTYV